jgi:hypothetical protein
MAVVAAAHDPMAVLATNNFANVMPLGDNRHDEGPYADRLVLVDSNSIV